MDEQCRWCAEGGNLICCDFCSNAFCKKCILRNLGRKELTGILESKWYCYVCNPEPLFGLVVACDNVLENMSMASLLNQHRSRNREESEKTESEELYKLLPDLSQSSRFTGMDGNVVFNYNTLHVSKEVTKKTQQLVESTNILNRTFLSLIRTVMTSKGPADLRRVYLNSFLSVVKGLKKSIAALEESLKEEFSDLDVSSWETFCDDFNSQTAAEAELVLDISDVTRLRGLRSLAAEHLVGESSESQRLAGGTLDNPGKDNNSCAAAHTAEDVRLNPSESGVSMTKKLVVKLTPVALGQDSTSVLPKQEDSCSEDGTDETAALKDEAGGDGAASHDASAVSLHAEAAEHSNRRSPRLKTTPLRRPSDAKAKASHPAADSDSESEGDSAAAPPANTEGRILTGDEDDSDSDEVPAALLEGAAVSHSSDDEGSQASPQVAKPRLFWLAKNTPLSADKMRRKRKMLGRSSDRKGSGSESSSDGRDLPLEIQHLNTLRSMGKRPLVQRESDVAARKKRRLQPKVMKSTSHREATDSSSSSSEDKHNDDDDDDNDEDDDDHDSGSESDQKMKPITEEVSLLGAAAFHQSSGDEEPPESGPSWAAEEEDDPENRIAKKILLAQINANFSSGDDISSDDETQEDESDSDGLKEVRQREERGATDEDGEGSVSDSSESTSEHKARHHLLQHKLSLDDAASKDKAAAEVEKRSQRKDPRAGSSDSEGEDNNLEEEGDDWMSDELSGSDGENVEDVPKCFRSPKRKTPPCEDVPCILLSDSSDEQSNREDAGEKQNQGTPKGRKKIRKIMKDESLCAATQEALKEEEERCRRLADREQQMGDSREVIVIEDELSQVACSITTKLILDQDPVTKEPLVQVHGNLVTRLKPHQVDGVQFIWDNCCESVKTANSSQGSGCILAHCMGLGKTLQVVTFLHTVLLSKNLNFKTALVVCPLNTVLNWISEFKKWQSNMGLDTVKVSELGTVKTLSKRIAALRAWHTGGGVMIMGYDNYRILSSAKRISGEELEKELKSFLVDPGPDFVVCDEGHILRKEASNISKTLNAIRTKRRVVLTGTPLQNNLVEYHHMVSFIKKNLLGSLREFRNRFINPIQNGQCADSTPKDVRIMKKRAHVLHAMLSRSVQRRDYSELTKCLPPKHEYVLAVRISPLQCELYRRYLDLITGGCSVNTLLKMRPGANLFKDFQVLGRIWTHPWCLELHYIREKEKREKNQSKAAAPLKEGLGATAAASAVMATERGEGTQDDISEVPTAAVTRQAEGEAGGATFRPRTLNEGWFKSHLTEADAKVMEHSGKMVLLFQILEMAEELGDKVLVFSQSLTTLNIIEIFLKASHLARNSLVKAGMWIKNVDYYRLDGSIGPQLRQKLTDDFNKYDNQRGRLFLISTKAGSLGINLIAANRVVMFDASWNPSYDIQSIYRVYRFGQLKQVYVYRLLAQGTMEEKIYDRQVTKQSLANRVVDQQQIERHFTLNELTELYMFKPDLLDSSASSKSKRSTPAMPQDFVLAQLLQTCKDQIVSFHEHESLLDHKEDEELSEAERKAAWDEYEAESLLAARPGHDNPNLNLTSKTNEELLMLLNKTRTNVSMAFQSLQKITLHTLQDYAAHVTQQYPLLAAAEVQAKAQIWKTFDETEQQRRQAMYKDVLAQQHSLTLRIQAILNSRRNQAMQVSVTTSSTNNAGNPLN